MSILFRYKELIISTLLLICLLPMPYGYYNLVRFIVTCYFGYMAFFSFEKQNKPMLFFYACSAILFNPFIKFHFGRTIWNILDVIYSCILIYLFIQNIIETKSKNFIKD